MATNNVEENKKRFLQALEDSMGIVTKAARKCKLDRKTHYQWMKDDIAYKETVLEMRNLMLDLAEDTLVHNMRNGDTQASMFILRYLGKKRGYAEKQEIDVTHSGTIKFEFGDNLDELPGQE